VFVTVMALMGAFLFGSFASPVLQETYRVFTRWIVPADVGDASRPITPSGPRSESGTAVDKVPQAVSPTPAEPPVYPGANMPVNVIPFALLGAIVGAWLGNRILAWLEGIARRWDKMHTGDKVNLFLGSFVGIVVALPFLLLLQALQAPSMSIPFVILGLTVGFAAVSVYALQSMTDVLPWMRGRGAGRRSGIRLLDTNVIIDGRVYDVARAGFLDGQLYVPQFVLEELQHIADSHDSLRRQRGRRGLEVLRHMQSEFPMEVGTLDKLAPEAGDGVDARLVRLARALGGDIVTNDFNLNRVAALQEVKVLNLNDLALSLRPNVLPQESLSLAIVREGNQAGQGVGYLDDGTMVVVEGAKHRIGDQVEIVVTQVIQTERGKMIFGELDEADAQPVRRARRNQA